MNSKLAQFVFITAVNLLLWFLLVDNLSQSEVIAGVVVSSLVSLITISKTNIFTSMKLGLQAPVSLLLYLAVFFRELVFANFDMARRVVSPSLPINPGVVTVRTNLKSDIGKLLLANSITLTPGTLSVDVTDENITVHWIDVPPDCDINKATQMIAAGFEKHIMGFLH